MCLDEKPEKALNGEDKGDSGVDTQNSEGNADEEDPLGPNCYYDKSKSFFDNISCDDMRLVLILWFAKISSKFHLYFLSFIFFLYLLLFNVLLFYFIKEKLLMCERGGKQCGF